MLAGILLVVAAIDYPAMRNDLILPDDYVFLSHAHEKGFSFDGLFYPFNGHVIPIFRSLIATEFKVFGTEPAGYYAVGILLHVMTTALLGVFVARLARNWNLGLAAALLFGASAAHWQPVIFILASNSCLAGMWYVAAAICFLRHVETSRVPVLVAALVFHACAFLSLSYGIEAPVFFFLLCLILKRELSFGDRLRRGLGHLAIFGLNTVLLLWLRSSMIARYPASATGHVSDLGTLIRGLNLELIPTFAGGIYEGFMKSYSGAYLLNPYARFDRPPGEVVETGMAAGDWLQAGFVALFFGALLILRDWTSPTARDRNPLIGCLLAWGGALYALPLLTRGIAGYEFPGGPVFKLGYHGFVFEGDRYRYLPGIPISAAFVLAFSTLRPLPFGIRGRKAVWVGGVLASIILVANAADLRRKMSVFHERSMAFGKVRTVLLSEVAKQLEGTPGTFQIQNAPFAANSPVGRLIVPSLLLPVYLPAELSKRIVYVAPFKKKIAEAPGQVFGAREDGTLFPLKPPRR